MTLWSPCALTETRDVATRVSGRKWVQSTELDMERVILQFMCVGSLAGVTYLRYTVLTSPNKGETAVHCCDPLSVLVMLVSRNVFHVVSALQSIVLVARPRKFNSRVSPQHFDHCDDAYRCR